MGNMGNAFISFGVPIQAFAELGRATAVGGETSLAVTNFANKKWLLVLAKITGATGGNYNRNIGGISVDTGSNYAGRDSVNGGADSTFNTKTAFPTTGIGFDALPHFEVWLIENVSNTNEKLIQGWCVSQNTAGAGTAPQRYEAVAKWADTTNPVQTFKITWNAGSASSGDEIVVLGADPSDTNVTPFFVEQARNTFSSNLSTQTAILASSTKYNFIMGYSTGSSNTSGILLQVGNGSIDTGNNYARRTSVNGAADTTTNTNSSMIPTEFVGDTNPYLNTFFILNTTSNEKLAMGWESCQNTAGAGNAPTRSESVGKWSQTSSLIDRFAIKAGAGIINSGSEWIWYGAN